MNSRDVAPSRKETEERLPGSSPAAGRRIEYVPREDGAVAFRCEACGFEMYDLRGVFLAYRSGGWRIECALHDDAEYQVDGGRLFGGGLHALDLFAGLARARWFEPAELFNAFLRLRAQASGLYVRSLGGSGDVVGA